MNEYNPINHEEINEYLNYIEKLLSRHIEKYNLQQALIEKWRWGQPLIMLRWIDNRGIKKNINLFIKLGQDEISSQKQYQVVIEANAWEDTPSQSEQNTMIRDWTHTIVNEHPLSLPIDEEILDSQINNAISIAQNWARGHLTKQATKIISDSLKSLPDIQDYERQAVAKAKIFISHGRDFHLLEDVLTFIKKRGLDSITLPSQPTVSLTPIEHLERIATSVDATIALLTPDDIGGLKFQEITRPRARQNVIFELGYFMAKLGRSKVIILAQEEIEMPSYLDVIEPIYINRQEDWKESLKIALYLAGIDI